MQIANTKQAGIIAGITTLGRRMGLTATTLATGVLLVGGARAEKREFFVFDNGLRHERVATIDQKLDLVKSVGFDGLSWRTDSAENIRTLLAGAKKRDLKVFAYYANIEIKQDKAVYSSQLKQLIDLCKGTGTCIWPNITSKVFKNSDPAADDLVVPVVRELAGLCESNGVRLVLYPHVNIWLHRVEDAVRIAKKVNHPNCGVAFNLCHALSDGQEDQVPALIREAAPYLRLVSINGANAGQKGPILPLGKGTYDTSIVLRTLDEIGYKGPVGLQCFSIPGDPSVILPQSMEAWKKLKGIVRQ